MAGLAVSGRHQHGVHPVEQVSFEGPSCLTVLQSQHLALILFLWQGRSDYQRYCAAASCCLHIALLGQLLATDADDEHLDAHLSLLLAMQLPSDLQMYCQLSPDTS